MPSNHFRLTLCLLLWGSLHSARSRIVLTIPFSICQEHNHERCPAPLITTASLDAFAAIGDPIRRHIIELLATQGSLTATEISSHFHVGPQAISKHLKVLRQANVLEVEKKAQQRIYSLNPETMVVVEEWARQFRLMWSERFKKLDRLLQARKDQLHTSNLERKDGQ
ncbi:metalloregulator ArsR/SmtB family transcription factor [Paenibacillus sp. GYB003]|uniref:metalloregulator ArsR/SmtB family transcription factor n=1 Tax=Paenibacillus sp. GYB003 TaxID=2994392 RepID=UPI002F9670CA